MHNPTKFQADIWNPKRVRAVTSSLRPGPKNYRGKFQSSVEHAKIGRAWSFLITICSMVLYIIPPNFRLIAEILKELERDGQTDGQTGGRPDAMTDDNTRRRRWRPRVKIKSDLINWFVYPCGFPCEAALCMISLIPIWNTGCIL